MWEIVTLLFGENGCIKEGRTWLKAKTETYWHRQRRISRKRSVHEDDTAMKDEWQLEVYLHAQAIMREHVLGSIIELWGCVCLQANQIFGRIRHHWRGGSSNCMNGSSGHILIGDGKSEFKLRTNLACDLVVCADVWTR